MSASDVGILRKKAAERMKDIFFRISNNLPQGKPLLCNCVFVFLFVVASFFFFFFSRSHCLIRLVLVIVLYAVYFLFNKSSAYKLWCLLQGAHGSLHDSNRLVAGGGNTEESNGESQQKGPPATLLSMTGLL